MIVTIQGKHALVTAYRSGGSLRAQVALLQGESALGDAPMLRCLAHELRTAALIIERIGGPMRSDREEDADGILLRA